MPTSFLDQLGATNLRLFLCFVAATILTVLGSIFSFGGEFVRSGLPFFGGALLALALASWQINAHDRALHAATHSYWKAFSEESVILLSTRPPDAEFEAGSRSPLTPFHDAQAGLKVQAHLEAKYETKVPIVSVGDLSDLADIQAKNVILIGGPNLNHLTDALMERAWVQHGDRYFHWSSTLATLSSTQATVIHSQDHFLRVQTTPNNVLTADEVLDLHDPEGNLIEARGMCLRLEGLLGPGSRVLLLAGTASAYGTLAAADYALDPDNLLHLSGPDSQLIVSAALNGYGLHEPYALRVL